MAFSLKKYIKKYLTNDGKKVCNFLIRQELDAKLREYCERTDKVKGKVIERTIEEYIERESQ